jgi:PAS domain S-box-containing protein
VKPQLPNRKTIEAQSAEAALRLSEATRSAILEAALDCIVTIDHHGRVVDFNPAAEHTFGFSRAEAIGREMAELIVPERLRKQHRTGMARAISTGQDHIVGRRIEITALRKNGEEFPVELAITRISTHGPPMFTGHIRDIARRKTGEQRQRAQYAVARILAEAKTLDEVGSRIIEAVCENLQWDMGALWQVDTAAKQLLCAGIWDSDQSRHQKFEALTRQSHFAPGVGLPGRIWKTGEPSWIEEITRDRNFPRASLARLEGLHSAFGFPIRLDKDVLGVIEFFSHEIRKPNPELIAMFDSIGSQVGQFIQRKRAESELLALNLELENRVTQRTAELHQTQQELRQALVQEKELSQLKSNFVTLVSHQFRTPLGIIMSAAEILDAYFDRLPPEKRRQQLQDIHAGTRQMADLLEQVLLLGRIESEGTRFKPASLDLNEFCQRLANDIMTATKRKCLILLQARHISDPALADQTLLRHILANLLSNSVNFSREGSQVQFTIERVGNDALFKIRDNGIGIPEQDTARLFTSFHRGSNAGELPGSGLGLVIAKRCVELHHGTLALQSQLNQGTLATVTLPVFSRPSAPGRASEIKRTRRRNDALARKPSTTNRRI